MCIRDSVGTVDYTTADGETKTGMQYDIPVAALDQALVVSSHSAKRDKWYARTKMCIRDRCTGKKHYCAEQKSKRTPGAGRFRGGGLENVPGSAAGMAEKRCV